MKDGSRIDGEAYVRGMAAAQISRMKEEEALKAWMIVCRTNFYKAAGNSKEIKEEKLALDYISPDQMEKSNGKKVYLSYLGRLTDASDQTFGKSLYYGNERIDALYHQVSPGQTVSSEEIYGKAVPYLVSVDSSQDVESEDYLSARTMTYKECAGILQAAGKKVSEKACRKRLKIKEQTEHGYVKSITAGKITLTGEEWKELFALGSPYYYIEEYEGRIRIVSLGQGHGMGMSLYGANALARQGKKAEDILTCYYPGIQVR